VKSGRHGSSTEIIRTRVGCRESRNPASTSSPLGSSPDRPPDFPGQNRSHDSPSDTPRVTQADPTPSSVGLPVGVRSSRGQPDTPDGLAAGDPTQLAPYRMPRAAYVHVPFCRHRCGYCDFTLVANRDDLIDRYLAALAVELGELGRPHPVQTLFLGGGTPSHLPVTALARLCGLLAEWLPLEPGGEFTVEANPLDLLVPGRVEVLARAGVNRISLGVQSFDPDVLRRLERDHSVTEVVAAVHATQPLIPNLGLDLIFGVPGQSLASWDDTLDRALALQPWHLSTYGLTIERGTSFYSRQTRGEVMSLPEELERDMYARACERLPTAGWRQYELSNFARPGCESRHNLVYWAAQPCLAFGPGAVRYLSGVREMGHRSTVTWLKRIEQGLSGRTFREELSPLSRAREALLVGLRRLAGIDTDEFTRDFGMTPAAAAGESLVRLQQRGLLEQTSAGWRLSNEGRFLADLVAVELAPDE